MNAPEYDAIVIGGGFYGCRIALELKRATGRVLLLERGPGLLRRASYANQARVHHGYHYPRSLLTGLRSRMTFPQFVAEYEECVDDGFDAFYAIGRRLSKVTAGQFRLFCERVGAPLAAAPAAVKALFNDDLIEDVFRVEEFSFDAAKLRARLERDLEAEGVEVLLEARARTVRGLPRGRVEVGLLTPDGPRTLRAARVFNCCYADMNDVLHASGLPLIPLKHELAEMPLVELPPPLERAGVTVMCGPFFSVWPFPSLAMHTLHHVRYTPHCFWHDREGEEPFQADRALAGGRASRFPHMIKDAARYLPALADCTNRGSLWEVKTVLPQSEIDDSRPILMKKNHGIPNFTCILGGKIDNVYDAVHVMRSQLEPDLTRAPA
jgi:glycine/D-amino acid oxidase-like deaminating enzyme